MCSASSSTNKRLDICRLIEWICGSTWAGSTGSFGNRQRRLLLLSAAMMFMFFPTRSSGSAGARRDRVRVVLPAIPSRPLGHRKGQLAVRHDRTALVNESAIGKRAPLHAQAAVLSTKAKTCQKLGCRDRVGRRQETVTSTRDTIELNPAS
ncbi:uncharacterized protein IWZ02DRAFT_248244 [Phyllosticta citriasiana]|uniref:uncharacterized protein n=1 Tax=Phyllosticta citriasiana TaxID=595635 RepID=UPI0030FD59D3